MRRFLVCFLLCVLAIWGAGFLGFLFLTPSMPKDTTTQADAIVVLTGGGRRVEQGVTLVESGLGRKLFISGVHPKVNLTALVERQKITSALELKTLTDLGYKARNTRENAAEIAEWVNVENIKSLRLVTAQYHLPRSFYELSHVLKGVVIIPHPFPYRSTFLNTLPLAFIEFHKYIACYFLRIL